MMKVSVVLLDRPPRLSFLLAPSLLPPPPSFLTFDTDIEMLGVFLFALYCSHVNDHILAGMQAFYTVSSA